MPRRSINYERDAVRDIELWLPIPDFEGIYEVSNHGRVRNVQSGQILKQATHRGYRHVALYEAPGKSRTTFVHVAVMRAFCGKPPFNGAEVCHNDGDRSRNRLTNLRWGSRQDNMDDRTRHGRTRFGTGVRHSKLSEQDVLRMRSEYRGGKSTYALARELKISTHTAWCAVTGKTWAHLEGAINNG